MSFWLTRNIDRGSCRYMVGTWAQGCVLMYPSGCKEATLKTRGVENLWVPVKELI